MATKEERLAKLYADELSLEEKVFGQSAGDDILENGDTSNEVDDPFAGQSEAEDHEDLHLNEDAEDQFVQDGAAEDDWEDVFGDKGDTHGREVNVDAEVAKLEEELKAERHRFNRYKGSTDRTIYELRQEVSRLSGMVANLKGEIAEAREKLSEQDSFLPVFDPDTQNLLGEETVNSIQQSFKRLEERVKLAEKKNEPSPEDLRKRSEDLRKENEASFWSGLEDLVPDYKTYNVDPDFIEWLKGTDSYGEVRLDAVREYQRLGNFRRVARYFNEYKRKIGPAKHKSNPKKVKDSIISRTGPVGTNQSSAEGKNRKKEGFIYQSQINKFNYDVNHGVYKYHPDKAEAIERKIFEAMHAGKIIIDEKPR